MMPKRSLFKCNKSTEEDILSKVKSSKLLVIDLDGTLIDFERIDHDIISQIYEDNKPINFLDRILWKVNRQDIFGNGYSSLKLRLWFYCLIGKKDYVLTKREYAAEYEVYSKIELLEVFHNELQEILSNGYDIVIMTKNKYASKILYDEVYTMNNVLNKNQINLIVQRNSKRAMIKKLADLNDGKVTIIGNNFSDDILTALSLKLPYIYIGKSKPVKALLNLVDKKQYEFVKNVTVYKKGFLCSDIERMSMIFSSRG